MSEINFRSDVKAELVKHNCADEDVARAAWVSNYGDDARTKDTERISGLINFLIREKHWSPVEHNFLTVYVEVPLFVRSEVHRHRTFSYNEWSGRYSEMLPEFYMPAANRPLVQVGKVGQYTFEPGTDEQYLELYNRQADSFTQAWAHYKAQLDAGIAKEVARNVLPVSTFTRFYMSGNLRNWFQFFALRSEDNALYEIRQLSLQIEDIVSEIAPITYAAWKAHK